MNKKSPTISCVIIGLDCEKTITNCILSIMKAPNANVEETIYVDSGSRDKSVAVIKSIVGVRIIELNLKQPTPGKARNAGWHAAKGEWVHFFDGDVVLDENWIVEAIKHIDKNVGAIYGLTKEQFPGRNWFHFVADLEWTPPEARAKFFGGDVLIKRSILEETEGYDEHLVAGEEPELSVRIRNRGWKILGVNAPMCRHDMNMTRVGQYVSRGIRSGYGYAEAGLKMLKFREASWAFKAVKIALKATMVLFLISAAIISKFHIYWIMALITIFFPFVKVGFFKRKFDIGFKEAFVYAFHCSIVLWLQFFGILKYFLIKLKRAITRIPLNIH